MSRFDTAKEMYASIGVDVDAALAALGRVRISMHCWQGDDVTGFEKRAGGPDGGIAAIGNYPGKARNAEELFADIDQALALIPGTHKLNLHASYAVTDSLVERDELRPEHFDAWVKFAEKRGLGLDFNPTFFSHPKAVNALTLTSPDDKIRGFWIDHAKASRRIAESFGKRLGCVSLNNLWITDGYKNIPADRLGPRRRLKEALDDIYAVKMDRTFLADCVEAKLFGLGLEAYTAGSHEFYLEYTARNPDILLLLDVGHFHPTEVISDKLSSVLLFSERMALHVSRPIRWDSDHVIILDDELKEIAKELVRCRALDRVFIGLDYFDASVNRVAAWVIGMRNMQKALLSALLTPHVKFAALQNAGEFTELMALQEELKLYPFGDIWDRFCEAHDVPVREYWFDTVRKYELDVLSKRK